jgi:hypothetical protein
MRKINFLDADLTKNLALLTLATIANWPKLAFPGALRRLQKVLRQSQTA